MAVPLSADRLLAALRAEGVTVVEVGDWRNHNRNAKGSWGPVHGVMIHHTGRYSSESQMVDLCRTGYSDLPGPLCHGVVAKDGTVYLVGYGRANHAGSGDDDVLDAVIAERALPADNETTTDGNARFYGFECINLGDGKDWWPPEQVEAAVRASAAILRAHKWGQAGDTSVIGHSEWQPGKVDPRGPGVSMPDIRTRVAERLKYSASWSPAGASEEDTMPSAEEIARAVLELDGVIDAPWGTPTNQTWMLKSVLTHVTEAVLRTESAVRELAAQGAARDAVLAKLAEGGGLDAAEMQAAAEAGAQAALDRLADALSREG